MCKHNKRLKIQEGANNSDESNFIACGYGEWNKYGSLKNVYIIGKS